MQPVQFLNLPPRPSTPQVALQRKMFEQYERRERARKVAELQDVVPGLSTEEVERALDLCNGRWAQREWCGCWERLAVKTERRGLCTVGSSAGSE